MNIDQQLRAALGHEAETRTAPAPDVDSLIRGGRIRRRRRALVRVGVAAAVAVLAAGGLYGFTKAGSGTAVGPAGPPSPTPTPQNYRDTGHTIQPGTYRMLVGEDGAGAAVYADLTFHMPWDSDNYPVLLYPNSNGGVAAYRPLALSAGTGCLSDNRLNTNIGDTPQALAEQLARLPQSTVLQSPASVQAFGDRGVHLRLRIRNDCPDVYRVAETARGGQGVTFDPVRAVVVDFWVLDVGGSPVVVDMWHEVDSPSAMVDEIARTRGSITFETSG